MRVLIGGSNDETEKALAYDRLIIENSERLVSSTYQQYLSEEDVVSIQLKQVKTWADMIANLNQSKRYDESLKCFNQANDLIQKNESEWKRLDYYEYLLSTSALYFYTAIAYDGKGDISHEKELLDIAHKYIVRYDHYHGRKKKTYFLLMKKIEELQKLVERGKWRFTSNEYHSAVEGWENTITLILENNPDKITFLEKDEICHNLDAGLDELEIKHAVYLIYSPDKYIDLNMKAVEVYNQYSDTDVYKKKAYFRVLNIMNMYYRREIEFDYQRYIEAIANVPVFEDIWEVIYYAELGCEIVNDKIGDKDPNMKKYYLGMLYCVIWNAYAAAENIEKAKEYSQEAIYYLESVSNTSEYRQFVDSVIEKLKSQRRELEL